MNFFEIIVLFDIIDPKKILGFIFSNPGIEIRVQSRDPAGAWSPDILVLTRLFSSMLYPFLYQAVLTNVVSLL